MDVCPPLLETREVLLNHLCAKVWPLCQSKIFAKDISLEITKHLTDKEIINLLENEVALEEAVCSAVSYNGLHGCKQALGEKLFASVANLESELCAQITGMLLELDEATLESLLSKEENLKVAVQKAKKEYLQYTQKQLGVGVAGNSPSNVEEDVGEVLYALVAQHHPDPELAARLTGMLLEIESCQLQNLVRHPNQLRMKLEVACRALANQRDSD